MRARIFSVLLISFNVAITVIGAGCGVHAGTAAEQSNGELSAGTSNKGASNGTATSSVTSTAGTLGPIEIEFGCFSAPLGANFSVAFKAAHHSGDHVNFSMQSNKSDVTSILSFIVRNADVIGASAIALLDQGGNKLSTYVATCNSSICLLEIKYDSQFEYGVYQVYPHSLQQLTLRVYYKDGSHKDSVVVFDNHLSL